MMWRGVANGEGSGILSVKVRLIGCHPVENGGGGSVRKNWRECVMKDMELLGLVPEWAKFRNVRDLIWDKRLTFA